MAKKLFEERDWNLRVVLITLGLVTGLIALAFVGSRAVYRHFSPSAPTVPSAALPPSPRLQTNERADLAAFRRREEEQLNTYGWVDRKKGVVRIPIGRAIVIVARESQ